MSINILIIEDEVDIREGISEYLSEVGYEVKVASDGQEGIDLFRQNKFDLVLLDIMLPKMDGLTVCKRVKQTYQIGLQNTFLFPCTKILGNKTGTGCIKSSHHIIYKRICICSSRISFYKNMVKGIDTALHKQIGEGK